METTRYRVRKITDEATKGQPVISLAVAHGPLVYLCGITPDPVGDVKSQTAQALEQIDKLLAEAGTDKSKLLSAQVWLADIRHFQDHNAVWNQWVDHENPPVRACVQAELWKPGMLVAIMVTATR